jgi:hypothetical protein
MSDSLWQLWPSDRPLARLPSLSIHLCFIYNALRLVERCLGPAQIAARPSAPLPYQRNLWGSKSAS